MTVVRSWRTIRGGRSGRGGAGYNNFVSKGLGLVMHPAAGVVIYVISAVTTRNPANASSAVYIFPIVMCVLLFVQVGAIMVARSRSGMIG